MNIRKASRLTLVGQVTAQIEYMIESGQWRVGEKIPPEPELMVKFDVSRNTLREAVQSLVHIGLLETRQGVGTTVKSNSKLGLVLENEIQKSDLFEILEVRLGLEREASQLAAIKRTDEDLKYIENCLDDCKIAAVSNDPYKFTQKDIIFHKSIVKATHNKMFIELYEHITDGLQKSIDEVMQMRNEGTFENELHIDLYDAIKNRNPQLALDSVNEYLNESKKAFSTMIKD